jgi:hypothetical protein
MDVFKSEPDSNEEVIPVSFQEEFEFVNMREPPSVWKALQVSCRQFTTEFLWLFSVQEFKLDFVTNEIKCAR